MSKVRGKKYPLVSFVVLNWNGLEDTKECLKSLRNLTYPNKEFIVVDNGSVDDSKDYFQNLKDIKFIDLPKNTGFTGGHIAGERVADGEYIALVNNDLVLDKSWTESCLSTFERHKDAAVVGGRAYKWNDGNPPYNINNEFYSYQEVNPETGHTRTLLIGEDECVVDSISGAALLIKKSCLNDVGYLDEDFFAYYEETDLIARLLRVNKKTYYCPTAYAWHKIAASSGDNSSFYLYMMHRNRYFFAVKNLDDQYLRHFLKNYRKEVIGSVLRLIKNSRDIDARSRLKAYLWTLSNKSLIFSKRKAVQALGGTYVKNLRLEPHKDVTVIIPCYNYGQYVSEAIESVLSQTLLPREIIVINDGSKDNTKDILKKYESNKLVKIVNKNNSGVIATKNLGLRMTKTYWTIFFDADDILYPTYIEKVVKLALDTTSDVVYTDMELFGSASAVFYSNEFSLPKLVQKNFIHNSALIHTSLMKQINGYKPIMKDGLEDWELYLSLAEQNARFGYLPEAVFKYRQHDSSISRNSGVLKKEQALYKLLLSLHPKLRRYKSPTRRTVKILYKTTLNIVKHPSLLIIVLKSLPEALASFLKTIVSNVRIYKTRRGI